MLRTVPRKWRTAMSDQPLYRPSGNRPVTRASVDARRGRWAAPPSWTDRTSARRRNDRTRRMYTNKKTIANSLYEEAHSELRAAVPSLQAIADRAFALAVATAFDGPRS